VGAKNRELQGVPQEAQTLKPTLKTCLRAGDSWLSKIPAKISANTFDSSDIIRIILKP
jgi:hypothetical protein